MLELLNAPTDALMGLLLLLAVLLSLGLVRLVERVKELGS